MTVTMRVAPVRKEITVKVHLQAVFKRLQVSNRTQAATYAMQRGWFSRSDDRIAVEV